MSKPHRLALMAFLFGGLLGCLDVVSYTEEPVHLDTFDEIIKIRYKWEAPTTGTKVAYYVGQIENNGELEDQFQLTKETWTFLDLTKERTYRFRVAGVDSAQHQGPFSIMSVPYIPGTSKEVQN